MDDKTQGPVTESDIVSVLPVRTRKKVLATVITRLIMGARVISPWHGRKEIAVIEDVYGSTKMSIFDFNIAKEIAEKIAKELGLQRVVPAHQVLVIRDRAQDIMDAFEDDRAGKHGIVVLKDGGGCGYWRMSLPSRYMDRTGLYIDVTGGAVDFDHLLEYETIFVQRVHNWESIEVLKRLRDGGKRIVYDIDDDLFNIPESNPAAKAYGRGEQMAAIECMKLSHLVTVSTKALQERLRPLLGGKEPMVIHNAIDPDESWAPLAQTGSPDEWKRIFWQGSNTHDEDWGECFEAVRHVMKTRDNVRLVVMGFLPSMVQNGLDTEDFWKDRVEYMGPMVPEAYFQIIKHIRADVGLAPLNNTFFNQAKSNIKWMENAMIGIPTVASNVRPYAETITGGKDGFLCSDKEHWIASIEMCLDSDVVRKKLVENARVKVRNEFSIKTVAKAWREVLRGSGSSDSHF